MLHVDADEVETGRAEQGEDGGSTDHGHPCPELHLAALGAVAVRVRVYDAGAPAAASPKGTPALFATSRSCAIRSSGMGTPCWSRSRRVTISGSPATSTGWSGSARFASWRTSTT